MSAGSKYKNKLMENLLEEMKSYGMKQVHLDLWEPYNGKDGEAVADDMKFGKDYTTAISDLVRYKKLAPINAVLELKQLKIREANVFLKLFELGMDGQFIREHRDQYELTHPNFISTLRYLVKTEKLPLHDALRELNTLDAHERYVLTLFYAKGLRGDLLRALRTSENAAQLADLFKSLVQATYGISGDTASYLISVIKTDNKKGATWQAAFDEAIFEARMLRNVHSFSHANERLGFLKDHVKDGVRANNVPVIYDLEKQKTYRVLRWVHRLSVMNALAQLKDLNSGQAHLLRKHFKAGLNHDVLINYHHSYDVTQDLMKHFHWKPLNAVKNLSALTVPQGLYLHDFAGCGLTVDQAAALKVADHSVTKKDVVLAMVEWGCDFQETLQKVLTMSDEKAQEMLKNTVSAPRAVPIKI